MVGHAPEAVVVGAAGDEEPVPLGQLVRHADVLGRVGVVVGFDAHEAGVHHVGHGRPGVHLAGVGEHGHAARLADGADGLHGVGVAHAATEKSVFAGKELVEDAVVLGVVLGEAGQGLHDVLLVEGGRGAGGGDHVVHGDRAAAVRITGAHDLPGEPERIGRALCAGVAADLLDGRGLVGGRREAVGEDVDLAAGGGVERGDLQAREHGEAGLA